MSIQTESPEILLLIPAYNEEARIGPVLAEYAEYFRECYAGEFSIVVVLNGCEDNTLGVVQAAQKEHPEIRYLNYEEPIGKGGALIEGLHHFHEADYIGYVDADGATQPPAFHDMINSGLYLPDYPLGHIIASQVEHHMDKIVAEGNHSIADEIERMNRLGCIGPDLWMKQATGNPVSAEPMIKAAAEALRVLGE